MAFRIGVDVDEVLAEFLRGFIAFHNEGYGTRLDKGDFSVYRFNEVLGLPCKEKDRRMDEFYQSPHYANIRRVPGAKTGVGLLKKGNTLVPVTSRPKHIKTSTGRWLGHHYGDAFEDAHFADYSRSSRLTKADICKREGLDLIIEDNPDFAQECLDRGILVIMPNRRWNAKLPDSRYLIRVDYWVEIPVIISNL